jgi:hypothetical protein
MATPEQTAELRGEALVIVWPRSRHRHPGRDHRRTAE